MVEVPISPFFLYIEEGGVEVTLEDIQLTPADVYGYLTVSSPTIAIVGDTPPNATIELVVSRPTISGDILQWDSFVEIDVSPHLKYTTAGGVEATLEEPSINVVWVKPTLPSPSMSSMAFVPIRVYDGWVLKRASIMAVTDSPIGVSGNMTLPLPRTQIEAVRPPLLIEGEMSIKAPGIVGEGNVPLGALINLESLRPELTISTELLYNIEGLFDLPRPSAPTRIVMDSYVENSWVLPSPMISSEVELRGREIGGGVIVPLPMMTGQVQWTQVVSAPLVIRSPLVVASASLADTSVAGDLRIAPPFIESEVELAMTLSGTLEVTRPILSAAGTLSMTTVGELEIPSPLLNGAIDAAEKTVDGLLLIPAPSLNAALTFAFDVIGELSIPSPALLSRVTMGSQVTGGIIIPSPGIIGEIDTGPYEVIGTLTLPAPRLSARLRIEGVSSGTSGKAAFTSGFIGIRL